jgi:hypothetical protein
LFLASWKHWGVRQARSRGWCGGTVGQPHKDKMRAFIAHRQWLAEKILSKSPSPSVPYRRMEREVTMAKTRARTLAGKRRHAAKTMHEFKVGKLKSGSGHKVRSRAQAVAIALRSAKLSRRR